MHSAATMVNCIVRLKNYIGNTVTSGLWVASNSTLDRADLCCVGPVVRITPDEAHLSDPNNYETIYRVGTRYWKDPVFYSAYGAKTTSFGAISHELHRVRRAALNPCFSRKMVLELEEVVHSKAQKLCNRVADAVQASDPADLHHGFRAVAVDVITDYAFDSCYNLLDKPGFGTDYFGLMFTLIKRSPLFLQFPLIQSIAMNTPAWLRKLSGGPMRSFVRLKEVFTVNFETNC
jgi:hypothetical protein